MMTKKAAIFLAVLILGLGFSSGTAVGQAIVPDCCEEPVQITRSCSTVQTVPNLAPRRPRPVSLPGLPLLGTVWTVSRLLPAAGSAS